MKQKTIQLILKILSAILAVLCGYFGVTSFTSCTVTRSSDIQVRAVIVTTDTTVINHSGTIKFPKQ